MFAKPSSLIRLYISWKNKIYIPPHLPCLFAPCLFALSLYVTSANPSSTVGFSGFLLTCVRCTIWHIQVNEYKSAFVFIAHVLSWQRSENSILLQQIEMAVLLSHPKTIYLADPVITWGTFSKCLFLYCVTVSLFVKIAKDIFVAWVQRNPWRRGVINSHG